MARHPDIPVETRPQDVTHLWELHKEILRSLVLGFRPQELAQMFNVTEGFISNLRNSPMAQQYLATLEVARDASTAEVARELMQTCPTAAKLLKDVIKGDIPASLSLQISTAKDWLSRGGFPPVSKTENVNKHGLTEETLNILKERANKAREEAINSNAIADADYEEVEE